MAAASSNPAKPAIALAIVGSNTTAIAAELVAATAGYEKVFAISRRNANTSLPIVMDGDEWAKKLKHPGLFGAHQLIQKFLDAISEIAGHQPFDCFIHHSKDPFSQLLSSHPLCRSYFYIEEGFTAIIGGTFGRPKKRPLQKALWDLKSRLFFGGRINRYREFFDTKPANYGGVYALSRSAFKDFPKRIQLDSQQVALALPLPAELVIFLDSQYFIGNCSEENYLTALIDCLNSIVIGKTGAAIKFHPSEKDEARRQRILQAVRAVPAIDSLVELRPNFVGERMEHSATAKVIVGTSAIGLYLGERGFQTFTFAPRLVSSSERFAKVMREIPIEFLAVCKSA